LSYSNTSVFMVDNGSADGSEGAIEREFPEVHVIQMHRNSGFATAANRGMQEAARDGAEFVWLLNNDTVVRPDALVELVRTAFEHPSAGFIGSAIYYAQQPTKIWALGGSIDLERFATDHLQLDEYVENEARGDREVDYVPGCSMLVRISALRRIGLMRECFFLYFEDADWSMRARSLGYKTMISLSSVVWHEWDRGRRESEPHYIRYLTRNRLWFCRIWNRKRILSALATAVWVSGGIWLRTWRAQVPSGRLLRIFWEFSRGALPGLFARIPGGSMATGFPELKLPAVDPDAVPPGGHGMK